MFYIEDLDKEIPNFAGDSSTKGFCLRIVLLGFLNLVDTDNVQVAYELSLTAQKLREEIDPSFTSQEVAVLTDIITKVKTRAFLKVVLNPGIFKKREEDVIEELNLRGSTGEGSGGRENTEGQKDQN